MSKIKSAVPSIAPKPTESLSPFTGTWNKRNAAHLLRRTTFGPSTAMIEEAVNLGLEATINQLLDDVSTLDPPVRYTLDQLDFSLPYLEVFADPNVAFGETWINEPAIANTGDAMVDNKIRSTRFRSLRSWAWKNFFDERLSILSKMTIFWHNHFVVADFRTPKELWWYIDLLQQNAVGNFRELTEQVTIDSSMLYFLNGRDNSKEAPNENYARELLELFTVGKGPLAGPGDYTTFTEQDVSAMARVLTGWGNPIIDGDASIGFYNVRHSEGSKQLSHRFGNALIEENGDQEYKDLIGVIFEQDATSINICTRLYRYFVRAEIDDATQTEIIEPLAQILRENDYELRPVLATLFSSAHFYEEAVNGCMIKNPIDFMISATRSLQYELAGNVAEDYFSGNTLSQFSELLQLELFNHPSVAGWQAYYQEPLFYRFWINTSTLPIRNYTTTIFTAGGEFPSNGTSFYLPPIIPVLELAAFVPNADQADALIDAWSALLFPQEIMPAQKTYLKEILIPGLPDFEWTVEYGEYLADPENDAKKEAIQNKLRALLVAMLEMPEFQLM